MLANQRYSLPIFLLLVLRQVSAAAVQEQFEPQPTFAVGAAAAGAAQGGSYTGKEAAPADYERRSYNYVSLTGTKLLRLSALSPPQDAQQYCSCPSPACCWLREATTPAGMDRS
jgi:hypothetical protein